MNRLSGSIADTTFGRVTNELDITEVYLVESKPSERAYNRKMKKGGWLKPSSSTRKALRSSFERSKNV
jgi:hypothetical protein